VADAHAVFDHLYATGEVVECGCWSHARRYWFKALSSDPERARRGLAIIKGLSRIERSLASAPRKKRERIRRMKSAPLVDEFFAYCEREALRVLDDTPISKAIRYALNQQAALRRFLEDGRLPFTNNVSERELRRQAVGRKNWLFVGSEDGAEAKTVFTSLLASCQMHGIEPYGYLLDLFCLLPGWPKSRVLELAPVNWKKTLQDAETQRLLDANIYRRVALDLEVPHSVVG